MEKYQCRLSRPCGLNSWSTKSYFRVINQNFMPLYKSLLMLRYSSFYFSTEPSPRINEGANLTFCVMCLESVLEVTVTIHEVLIVQHAHG